MGGFKPTDYRQFRTICDGARAAIESAEDWTGVDDWVEGLLTTQIKKLESARDLIDCALCLLKRNVQEPSPPEAR
jgi:hypothetical protein